MNYGYNPNSYQQTYRPYGQPQPWQQPMQQPMWQPPAPEPPAQESPQEVREDPVVTALRELTAEVSALRRSLTKRKQEVEDE